MHSSAAIVKLRLSWHGLGSYTCNQSHLQICSLSFVPFVSRFSHVSYYGEVANLPSKVVIQPPHHTPSPLSGSLGSIHGQSWPSLLSAECSGLKAAVSCPPFPSPGLPVMLLAPALSPWSTKLLWICAAIHSQHVVSNHLLPTLKAEHCANLPPQLGEKDSVWYKAAGTVKG